MKITIAGCGIVGATIAYELSKVPELAVTVVDPTPIQPDVIPNQSVNATDPRPHPNPPLGKRRELDSCFPPYQGGTEGGRESVAIKNQLGMKASASATGAALGVLMGAISKKEKGRSLRLRLYGIRYYNELVAELAELTGRSIPFNRQGILMLQFPADDLTVWNRLIGVRQQQDLTLELWNQDRLNAEFPFLDRASAAVYSPFDRQINPVALTQALIEAAKLRGVQFQFGSKVLGMQNQQVQTSQGWIDSDYLIIAAGVGSRQIASSIDIRPVLGQAIQLKLPTPLSDTELPVITGNDVHLVPLGGSEYWIGATVEFPSDAGEVLPLNQALWDAVMQQAIEFCPKLATGEIVRSWFGLRPRPQGRPAPVIEQLEPNVLLASGHYRNGVLLAPATAEQVKATILQTASQF